MLTIDRALYADAADLLAQGNQTLATIASDLFDALSAAAVSVGEGDGARSWCGSYENAADAVATELSQLIDAVGNAATLLDASGHNHAAAEAAAAPYGLPFPSLTGRELASVSLSGIPSMYGGNVGEPWGWSLVADHLDGFAWPGADIDRIRRLASAWHKAGDDLRTAISFAADAIERLALNDSPELPQAITVCQHLNSACLALADDCDALGTACTAYADAVSDARSHVVHAFKELLGVTGIGALIGIGASFVSGGLAGIASSGLEGTVASTFIARIVSLLDALSSTLSALNPAMAISDAQGGQSAWLKTVADAAPVLAAVEADTDVLAAELDPARRGGAPKRGGMTDDEIIRVGWADRRTLAKHLQKHADDVGAKSEADYVRAAQELLARALRDGLPMKVASDGTIRVFDPTTELFASYRSDGRARTIFRPDPPVSSYWSKQPGVLQ